MSWSNTYSHTLAIAADIFTASTFWNTEDVTVSSLAGLALRRKETSTFLARLGKVLNVLQRNHCEGAITSDLARLDSALALLTAVPNV
jgi:hypothetical protein